MKNGPDPTLLPAELAVLTTLFDEVSDGVCVSDSEHRILYLNPAAQRIMGVKPGDLERTTSCELLAVSLPTTGLRACAENCPLRDANSKETAVTFKLEGLRVRCLKMPHSLPGARGLSMTFIEDSSAERDLDRHKEDWRHMVAHDLRAPLTSILAALTEVARAPERAVEPAWRTMLKSSLKAADRMVELLNLYLDIARLDAGVSPVKRETVDLAKAAAQAIEEQSQLAADSAITVVNDVPEGLAVLADPGLLHRVLQNLLNNALKYAGRGRTVEISARPISGGMVTFSVADDGPGISPQHLPYVFDRFYQAEARRKGSIQGTGLGLTFCQQAVRSMGGRIYVVSEPDNGAEFIVQLPAAASLQQ